MKQNQFVQQSSLAAPNAGPCAKIVEVTPEMAQMLLEQKCINRAVRPGYVMKWVNTMKAGGWDYNGQTISLTPDGKLLDGQHRLTAVIEYGKSVKFLIAFNVPEEKFTTIDTGAGRSPADVLRAHGAPNYSKLCSIIRAVVAYDVSKSKNQSVLTAWANTRLLNSEYINFYDAHQELCDQASNYHRRIEKHLFAPGGVAAAYFVVGRENKTFLHDTIWERLVTREGLTSADQAKTLILKLEQLDRVEEGRQKKSFKLAHTTGQPPVYGFTTLHLEQKRTERTERAHLESLRASPRLHFRRGHVRKLPNGDFTWVTSSMVGQVGQGVKRKEYNL